MTKISLKILVTFIFTLHTITSNAEVFTAHCRDYPPELSFDGNKCVGAIPDLITDIVNELGHEIFWREVPWIRSLKMAKDGEVDLLIRHSMTEERKLFLSAIPYGHYTRKLSFYKSAAFNSKISSYEDIKKHNIGAIRGNFYSSAFSMLDTHILTLVENTEQLLVMLERGRIDLVVTSSSHKEKLFSERFEKVTFVDSFYNPLYLSIPKNSKATRYYKDIAKLLLDYRKSKKVDQYFQKYGLDAPKQIFE